MSVDLAYKPVSVTDCILWDGRLGAGGYGVLWRNGKDIKAHRMIWEECFGGIPPGMCICHKCDTPSCINPEHLFMGTRTDNRRDASKKGRLRRDFCMRGHALVEDNIYVQTLLSGQNQRQCRECNLMRGRARPSRAELDPARLARLRRLDLKRKAKARGLRLAPAPTERSNTASKA